MLTVCAPRAPSATSRNGGVQSRRAPVIVSAGPGRARAPEILGRSHVEQLGLDTQGWRRPLDLCPLKWESRITHIEKARDACNSRNHLVEQLDPFDGHNAHRGPGDRDKRDSCDRGQHQKLHRTAEASRPGYAMENAGR
jgi:hypothetical protein